jgi:hypothetical protein
MTLVRNRHAAHVGGLAPGATGDVSAETLARYPWAFDILGEVQPVPPPPPPLTARQARQAIRGSDDPAFIRRFLGDPRSSIHQKALARLKRLEA